MDELTFEVSADRPINIQVECHVSPWNIHVIVFDDSIPYVQRRQVKSFDANRLKWDEYRAAFLRRGFTETCIEQPTMFVEAYLYTLQSGGSCA
jgi:hypothetical protein